MNGPTPRLEIHPGRIGANARAVVDQCACHGVEVAAVTKVLHADPILVAALRDSGVTMLADSRLDNLARVAAARTGLPTMLLRSPTPRCADRAVALADVSLNSCLVTMTALSEAAGRLGRCHGVIVMVDVGDLREGVWPDRAVEVLAAAARLPHLDVMGVGANLACYGGVLPSRANMELLVSVRDEAAAATGLPLAVVSGGNSANLPLMRSGAMPAQVTQLRIGEAIILGRNTVDRSPWPGTRQDTVEIVAEAIEVERKPSVPLGATGQDAFGHRVVFEDRGLRTRAICDLGRQDVDPATLTPVDPGHVVLGASSDHLIVDVTDGLTGVGVGTEVRFRPSYAGLLAAATSPQVARVAVSERAA